MIELRRISKHYAGLAILNEVSLLIQPGECVRLQGGSGAGKTTLLRLIAGLDTPDSGEILLRHHDSAALAPHQRNLAYQFQDSALWPHLSLLDNVAYPLNGDRRQAHHFLERAGLSALAHRKPSQVSGGEARRAALARALAPRRDILLLDEPLACLPPQLQEQMSTWIAEELKLTQAACLWVAHQDAEAYQIAHRTLYLANATLTAQAGPSLQSATD